MRAWAQEAHGHRAFARQIVRLEAEYECFPSLLWDDDPALAGSLLAEHNEAVRLVMATYEAINELQALGYQSDAPPEGKRHGLARWLRRRDLEWRALEEGGR